MSSSDATLLVPDDLESKSKEAIDILSDIGSVASDLLQAMENAKIGQTMTKLTGALSALSFLGPAFAAVGALLSIVSLFTGGGDPVMDKLNEISNQIEDMREGMDARFDELAGTVEFSNCKQSLREIEDNIFSA